MPRGFARLVVWTLRSWFASDRSVRALARLELAWTERGLAAPWSRLAPFLSIVDFERERDLDLRAPDAAEPDRVTRDEVAVLAALTCARWSAPDAARCLGGFLDTDSAHAAARTATRLAATITTPGEDSTMHPLRSRTNAPVPTAARVARRTLPAAAALGLALVAPAAIAGPQCTTADRAQWQDPAKFQQQLQAQGYRIKVFKVTDGNCYEIYGWDAKQRKVEIYFDPVSGKAMKTEIG